MFGKWSNVAVSNEILEFLFLPLSGILKTACWGRVN